MRYRIYPLEGYLRAELLDRETTEETREFLAALAQEALRRRVDPVIICVHSSRPIFRVEEYQASLYLRELAARPEFKVALVSSRQDIRAAHEYIEVLARQHGARLRSFADEAPAVAWLRSRATEQNPVESARADSGLE